MADVVVGGGQGKAISNTIAQETTMGMDENSAADGRHQEPGLNSLALSLQARESSSQELCSQSPGIRAFPLTVKESVSSGLSP
jgi:hypothetical protein